MKIQKYLIYITVAIALLRASCLPIPISIGMYYGWFAILMVIAFLNSPKLNIKAILLAFVSFMSILSNDVPPIFRSGARWASFVIMLCAIGPMIDSKWSYVFKVKVFDLMCKAIIICVLISFVGYIVRFPMFFMSIGFFKGVTNHCMTMSLISGFSVLFCFYYYSLVKKKKIKRLYLGMCIISMITCLLGGSRAALMASLVAMTFYLWFYLGGKMGKFLKWVSVIVFIVIITTPLWYNYTEAVRFKMKANREMGGMTASREGLWELRLDEFKKSPIVGIGFASVDITNPKVEVSQGGVIEPGSSWLFILSTTGILGFAAFLSLFLPPILSVLKRHRRYGLYTILCVSLLIYLGLHMVAEGYAFSSGDISFLLLWLTISVSNILTSKDSKKYSDLTSRNLLTNKTNG